MTDVEGLATFVKQFIFWEGRGAALIAIHHDTFVLTKRVCCNFPYKYTSRDVCVELKSHNVPIWADVYVS